MVRTLQEQIAATRALKKKIKKNKFLKTISLLPTIGCCCCSCKKKTLLYSYLILSLVITQELLSHDTTTHGRRVGVARQMQGGASSGAWRIIRIDKLSLTSRSIIISSLILRIGPANSFKASKMFVSCCHRSRTAASGVFPKSLSCCESFLYFLRLPFLIAERG